MNVLQKMYAAETNSWDIHVQKTDDTGTRVRFATIANNKDGSEESDVPLDYLESPSERDEQQSEFV